MSLITELPLNKNGHETWKANVSVMFGKTFTYTHKDTGEVKEETIEPHCLDWSLMCGTCGEYLDIEFDTEKAWTKTECRYPNGITTEILLKVPSGRLVIDDDLRDYFDYRIPDTGDREGYLTDPEGMASYNSALGQAQAVEAMAKAGCAYGPVGNTCPGFYQTGEGTYVIANEGYVMHGEGMDDEDYEDVPVPGTRLAFICTDLWAYSVADYDDYVAQGGIPEGVANPDSYRTFVEVPAGTYKFTHHTGERGFNPDSHDVTYFAHVERVSD